MKAKQTFVLSSIVGAALVLGLAAFVWLGEKDGALTNLASRGLKVRMWDASSGKPVTQLAQHSGAVSSVWFSPDGRQLVTKSHDGTARLWDARTGNLLTNLPKDSKSVTTAWFSPDGKQIITSSRDDTLRVWKVEEPSSATRNPGAQEH
jgi:WD40 repeat protein